MTALAAGEGYIHIGTDSGRVDIASGETNSLSCGNGTATYDANTNTLTLENATINTEAYSAINVSGSFPDNTLNIVLKGANTVTTTKESGSVGINVSSAVSVNLTAEDGATLEISALGYGISTNGGNLTVNGVSSLKVNNATTGIGISSNGNCNITNSKIDIPNVRGGALNVNGGNLTIENSEFTAPNYGDTAIYVAGTLTMANSKITANGSAYAVFGGNGVNVSDSELTLNSETSNAIWTNAGSITISRGTTTVSAKFPALYASSTIDIKDGAKVTADSKDVAIFSKGTVSVSDSTVDVTSPANMDSMRGDSGTSVANSWIESHEGALNTDAQINNSVVFQDNEGTVVGSASLLGNVEISKDMTLNIPEGTSLIIPEGTTLTNNGEINLEGQLTKNDNLICNSHIGGTATCTNKAVCTVCGSEYGSFNEHNLTPVERVEATCTTAGKEAYYTCEVCQKHFSDAEGKNEITNLEEYGIIPTAEHKAGTEWKHNETSHWNECINNNCGEKLNKAAHSYKWVVDKEATATEAGIKHEECTVCGYEKAEVEIPATGTTEPTDPDPSEPSTPSEPDDNKDNPDTGINSPQTGDDNNLALWFVLLFAAAGGLTATTVFIRKRKAE